MLGFTVNQRLNSTEFDLVFKQGRRFNTPHLIFGYLLQPQPLAKIGFVISKKKIPLATRRNRLRRMCRESFRLNQQKIGPYWIVVTPKNNIKEAQEEAIKQEIQTCWDYLIKKAHE